MNKQGNTLQIVEKYPQWLVSKMETELQALDVNTNCGKDCAVVLDAAVEFVARCPDVSSQKLRMIVATAVEQCNVFYFG